MKTILLLPLLLCFCFGCDDTHQITLNLKERGKVYDTAFMPAGHGHGESFNYKDWSTSSVDTDIPARYAIVFKCQHGGKFVIDGSRGEALYRKLEKGQSVIIDYQENWRIVSSKTATNRYFESLHFLDANPVVE